MSDPEHRPNELDEFIRAGLNDVGTGVRSGIRGSALFIAAGVFYGSVIGDIELMFYRIPFVALGLWLLTGMFIFRACERGDI